MSKEEFFKRQSLIASLIRQIEEEHVPGEYSTAERMSNLIKIRFHKNVSPEEIQNFLAIDMEEEDILLTRKHAGLYGNKI